MPIPELDDNGFLPEGIHDCTLQEIAEAFATTDRRKELMLGLDRYLADLAALNVRVEVCVDGGFTTRKAAEPKDIDVVIDITNVDLYTAPRNLQELLDNDHCKRTYGVDVNPRHDAHVAIGDCRLFFAYVREETRQVLGLDPNFRKGLLRVAI